MKAAIGQEQHFNCIAMKRSIQRQITSEAKGMTPHERLAYYRKLANESPFASLTRRHNRKETRS